jgi:hypothetical protein
VHGRQEGAAPDPETFSTPFRGALRLIFPPSIKNATSLDLLRLFFILLNSPILLSPNTFTRLIMNYQPRSQELSWAKPLSVDLLLKVLNVTFLHPFVAWMVPLCMRAQAMKWTHPAIQIAIGYASLLTALYFLDVLNKQIAFSKPRKVDLSDEVIVVTGGASGLGLLIAEVYGMRGATVAVLDVKDLESGEARGVSVYKCDVGDKEQVKKVAIEIERDVCPIFLLIESS